VVADVAPSFANAEADGQLWFGWIQCLSEALSAPASATNPADRVVAYLQTHPISLEAHRLTTTALRRTGREATAHTVLAVSTRLYPESPWLRAQQAEVERAQTAAHPATPELIAPPATAVTANWHEFFRQLDELIGTKDWSAADQLIATVRRARPPPAWLAAHEADLSWRELQTAQGRHDPPVFRLTARLYLNGSLERADQVLTFARGLHANGAPDDAVLLVKAVLEKSPDHPLATSMLAEWQRGKKI